MISLSLLKMVCKERQLNSEPQMNEGIQTVKFCSYCKRNIKATAQALKVCCADLRQRER